MSRRIFNSPKPQGFCSHGRRKWTRIPPNPSRLANGQGQGQGQGFRPPPPFTTCKWTRVAGPPTLHDLGAASKWTRVGGPPQPFTTCPCGWGAPQPFTTWGRLPQIELSITGPFGSDCTYPSANLKFCLDKDSRPTIDKSMTGPFGPERTPTQTLNFVCIEHMSKGTRSPSTE